MKPALQGKRSCDELLEQELVRAEQSGDSVAGVIRLQHAAGEPADRLPTTAKEMAATLLRNVEEMAGSAPDRVNVLGNLATVILQAKPKFWRKLLEQPEVIGATANERKEDLLIRPVRKRVVKS